MKKDKLINLRISSEKHAEYMKLANSKGINLSDLIRKLLDRELEDNNNE